MRAVRGRYLSRRPRRRIALDTPVRLSSNRVFETADSRQVCLALGNAVRAQNVTAIAVASGIERAHLYGGFSSETGPRLSTVTKMMAALRIRFVAVQSPLSHAF